MLHFPGRLPEGALIGNEAARLAERLAPAGAVWFSARADRVRRDGEGADAPVVAWESVFDERVALPSRPNEGNGRFDDGAPFPGMVFRPRLHCGYAAEAVLANAAAFSAAVIYASPGRDGRTLLSVGGREGGNLVFLSETDGKLVAKDRDGGIAVECDAPLSDRGRALVMISLEPTRLRLRVGHAPVIEARGGVAGLSGAAELFIGCRSHRGGLQKTLGDARLSDVIVWQSGSVLSAPGQPDTDQAVAVRDYWRWTR